MYQDVRGSDQPLRQQERTLNNFAPSFYQSPQYARRQPQRQLFAVGGNGAAYLTFAALCTASFVYAFFADFLGGAGETARIVAIIGTAGLTMVGAAICLFRGLILASILSVAGVLSIFLFLYIFSFNSGVPFTLNSGGEYIGLTFTGLFALTLQDKTFKKLMKWFYWLCVTYAFFYLIASAAVRIGLVDTGGVARAVATADDAGRSDRLHSASLLLLYGTGYSVASLREKFSIRALLLTTLFASCWVATESRAITLLVVIAVLGYAILKNVALLGRMTFIVFVAGSAFSVMLIVDPSLNPFLYFGDQSASVRTNSIDIVSQSIQYYWLTGAGISFGVENYKPLTGITYFFPGDIGMIGILYTYGIAGFLLYTWLCYLGCVSYEMVSDAVGDYAVATGVALSCIVYALYSLQSPQYNGGSSGSIFAMMLVALVLHLRRETPTRRRM